MSAHDPSHQSGGPIRFETRDLQTRPIYLAGLALAAAAVVFIVIAWGYYQALAKREAARSQAVSPLSAEFARKQPPEPRLQSDARGDLLAMHAAENQELTKLAWVDEAKGTVQIPIDRAMDLLIAKRLPARPGASPVWLPTPTGIDPLLSTGQSPWRRMAAISPGARAVPLPGGRRPAPGRRRPHRRAFCLDRRVAGGMWARDALRIRRSDVCCCSR